MKATVSTDESTKLTVDTETGPWLGSIILDVATGEEVGDLWATIRLEAVQCRELAGLLVIAAETLERRGDG